MPSSLWSAEFAKLEPASASAVRTAYATWVHDPTDKNHSALADEIRRDVRWLVNRNLASLGDTVLQECEGQAADALYAQAMQDFQISSDNEDESGIAFWLAQLVYGGLEYLRAKPAAKLAM
jgi:hypothetical protein